MEVTSKLEAMLARIGGLKNINSTSGNNYGRITLELDKHTSMDMVRFEASTIIRQTWPSLPSSVSYPSIYVNVPDAETSREFMVYNIDAMVSPIIIRQYAEEHIKPLLAQIPGIYKIDVSGATPMEWLLEYDITRLDALGISPNAIRNAINAYNQKESLGMALIETDDAHKRYMRMSITSETPSRRKGFHAEDIYIADREGRMLRLDQLVSIIYREQPPSGYFRINGLNSIYLSLTASEDANQLHLSKLVKDEINNIKQTLPKGFEMHNSYDATEHIDTELNKIYIRTVLTILILLVFVFLTTFNPRSLLLILLSLYFNITIAFIFYYMMGLEIQLYSLAGITISLSLVIDNTIIMADHYLRNRDYRAFLSILAATLTTVGALMMIFFLDERIRLNLQDFASVVVINLLTSLAVSLLFVPAAIEKMNIRKRKLRMHISRLKFAPKKAVAYFDRIYFHLIRTLLRFRPVMWVLLIFGFGLPVFMIPDKIEGEGSFALKYNKIATSSTFKEKIRPIVETSLGGSLRLFVQKVYEGSYFNNRNDEVSLSITATMPNGATLQQMNDIVKEMESYLSQYKEIRQFQTSISSARRANIQVYFTKDAADTGFPYTLKSNVITKALQLGGGSWYISGLQDHGFSNDVRDDAGSMRIKMYGYNYDDLSTYADSLKSIMLSYRRISEVLINSQFSSYKDDYQEFTFKLDPRRMAAQNIKPYELYASISPVFGRDIYCGYVMGEDRTEDVKMSSVQSRLYDLWSLANLSRSMNGAYYKTGEVATITKSQTPQSIVKENQQYILCFQYEYVGSSMQANKKMDDELKAFNAVLPLGYAAASEYNYYRWGEKDRTQYLFLGVIILIIFFMTSILFNSLKQPLAIICVIPVSYIGVFLTFYAFKLNFDQGGFASFVLLCGITVNAGIYLITEFNRIRADRPLMNPVKAYIKAWNIKIVPIFLTIISTMLGFIPFMAGMGRESFWFPLAAGTIGGLVMSLAGIFFFLPLFLIKRKYKKRVNNAE
jgi:multidrug efflux pump subunit AcrB